MPVGPGLIFATAAKIRACTSLAVAEKSSRRAPPLALVGATSADSKNLKSKKHETNGSAAKPTTTPGSRARRAYRAGGSVRRLRPPRWQQTMGILRTTEPIGGRAGRRP